MLKDSIPSLEDEAHFSWYTLYSSSKAAENSSVSEIPTVATLVKNETITKITKLAYCPSLDYVSEWAIEYLSLIHSIMGKEYIQNHCAVVMDIDDTIVTRSKEWAHTFLGETTQFGGVGPPKENIGWMMKPTRKLFDACLEMGYSVFFITARPDFPENVKWTRYELSHHGFDGYTELFMIPSTTEKTDTLGSEYKRRARSMIETRHGKSIVLNIGDRWSDLLLYPDGDRQDGKVFAHNPTTRPDSLAFGLLHHIPNIWNYIAILPDSSWISIKVADMTK